MKKWISFLLVLMILCAAASGCGSSDILQETRPTAGANAETQTPPESSPASQTESVSNAQTKTTAAAVSDSEMFTKRDHETGYKESDSILIQLNGDTAVASSNSVQISGSTITITENATHILCGTLHDGMIIVNAEESAKLQLVFNGVNIHSETSAALYILEADKVFVTLAEGTENSLSNGGSFTAIDENNIDAALFSKQDLTMNGTGSLTVTSPAGHGIAAKDDLVLTGGTYCITSASHGLDANDSVRITGSTSLQIDAGKDGIHVENTDDTALGFFYMDAGTLNLEAEGDGIAAGAYVQITDGTFQILAGGGSVNGTKASSDSWGGYMGGPMGGRHGGGKHGGDPFSTPEASTDESSTSMKGIKAADGLYLSGGKFTIDSADDALHSDASASITGGSFTISSGDDAVHAEETLTIAGGTMQISQSYEGLEALHIDIQDGDIRLAATDDGLNAAGGTDGSGMTGGRDGMFGGPGGMYGGASNGSIAISGGNLHINASGDGIDANGSLLISGGYTVVVGPTQGDTATLDYDVSAQITGGTFIGTGASGMAQTFSDSEQGVFAVSVGNQAAGTQITLTDTAGNTILSYTPELSFAVVILSTPDILSGETYTITVGDSSGEFEAY